MWEGQIKEKKKCPNELSLFGWIKLAFCSDDCYLFGKIRICSDELAFCSDECY